VQTVTSILRKIPLTTWLSGFLILLIYEALDAGVNDVLEVLFKSSEGTPNWVWFIAAFSVFINIIFPIGLTFWLLSSLKATRSWSGDFQQLLIETLRVWGKILLYSLALIIPGAYKWLSTTFVPYVVLFSKKYHEGQLDAIAGSKKIFKQAWGRTILILLIFSVVVPLIVTANLDQYREIWVHPLGALCVGVIEYFSLIFSLFLFLFLFIKVSREVNDELIF
jgi:hypothetical protein